MTMRHAKKTVLSSTFTVLAIIGRACQAFSTNINHSPSTYRGSSASVFIPAARGLRPSSHSKLWRRRGASQRDSRGGAPTCSSSRLSMVDSTDLFQLQQWAGDLSQQEVHIPSNGTLQSVCSIQYCQYPVRHAILYCRSCVLYIPCGQHPAMPTRLFH